MCKHMVAAAIILGDLELQDEGHRLRAEILSVRLSTIRERVFAGGGERADHIQRAVLRRLGVPTDPRVRERRERELHQHREALLERVEGLHQEHMRTRPDDLERRHDIERELGQCNEELSSVRTELDFLRPTRRVTDTQMTMNERDVMGMLMRRDDLVRTIAMYEQTYNETPLHMRQRREDLRREMDQLNTELAVVNRELESIGPVRIVADRQRDGTDRTELDERIGDLRRQSSDIEAALVRTIERMDELRSRTETGEVSRQLTLERESLDRELHRLYAMMADIGDRIQRLTYQRNLTHGILPSVDSPRVLWECGPPGSGC